MKLGTSRAITPPSTASAAMRVNGAPRPLARAAPRRLRRATRAARLPRPSGRPRPERAGPPPGRSPASPPLAARPAPDGPPWGSRRPLSRARGRANRREAGRSASIQPHHHGRAASPRAGCPSEELADDLGCRLDPADVADGLVRVAGHRPDLPAHLFDRRWQALDLAIGSVCPSISTWRTNSSTGSSARRSGIRKLATLDATSTYP